MILAFQVCFTDLSLNLLGEHSQSIRLGKSSSCDRESATFFIMSRRLELANSSIEGELFCVRI